ncbi:hypothetical protein FGADI_7072 [Fusarium gaditjirri]|uniref:Copper transport protein n=1 Tax=Fusarium gaditjirri TaxID=282569 RepID=A0A8H4T5Z1_9HYPO|nr:hypothetical protein FGADI_7072 [Fusarium gaditjirri]
MKMDMTTSTGSSMPMSTSGTGAMDMEQMNMVFFTSTKTLLWTKSFAPETTGQYAGVCIFLIAFATILRMLLAIRVNFYGIRDVLRRRRTKGLLAEHQTSEIGPRPWRANEAMTLGAIDVVIAGISYLLSSWIGVDAYDPGDELHAFNNGVPYSFSQKFSIGHFNMVRRIDFTNGTSWVARVRLPELRTVFGDREALGVASTLKLEVSMEYHDDLSNHPLQFCVQHTSPDVQTASSFANPILFRHLMSLYRQHKSSKESFSLVNRDFGAHNPLVDEIFQIVGMIDFDGVMAAPVEVVSQHPVLAGLIREPPGCIETRPAAIERIERTKPKLKKYKEMLAAVGNKLENNDKGATTIADLLLSDSGSAFQGLVRYQGH